MEPEIDLTLSTSQQLGKLIICTVASYLAGKASDAAFMGVVKSSRVKNLTNLVSK